MDYVYSIQFLYKIICQLLMYQTYKCIYDSYTLLYICDRISWEEWNVHLVRLWLQEPDTRADSRKLGLI